MYATTLLDNHLAATTACTGEPLIVDSFAGGGGASTGIELALGRSPDIAINHNPAALALHAANHPETLHISENVYKVDPLDYLRGRHVGLAWFSPDCKHFSKAKGGKPVERNIRDLAWIIPGWIERIRKSGGKVDVVIMENVEEFSTWGPLIETEKGMMPDPAHKGATFKLWCDKLKALGGRIEKRELRACDYGAPTIRKRLFVIIRFDKQKIVWPEPTHGAPDDPDVIAGRKLPWRTAAEIIDWSIPCPSIFDTGAAIFARHGLRAVRPLADNTLARIARGMKRYVLDAERPFLVNLTHGARCEEIDEPVNTVTCANRGEKAVISPSVIRFNTGATGQDLREPLSTVTANSFIKRPGGAAPLGVIAPHLSAFHGAGDGGQDRSAAMDEPLRTVTTGNRRAVVAPVLSYAQQGGGNRSVEDPHHTITASDKDQNQVVGAFLVPRYGERDGQEPRSRPIDAPAPVVVPTGNGASLVSPVLVGCGGRAAQSRPRGGDEPVATITAKADGCVAAAFVAQHNNDSRRIGGVNPGREADEPLSTVTATGAQQGVVNAFISRQFGTSTGHALDDPLGTITADGQGKSALIAPFMQKYYGTGDGSKHDEPCHTVTTKDRHGHIEAMLDAPPFTPEMEDRARAVADFMRAQGFWDAREFVTLDISAMTFVIVDIGMRMLTPRELYNAQGFPGDYQIERGPDGQVFSKSVQVSCVGNSVSPPVAKALVRANCGHLMRQMEAAE